jgi:Methyltransferase domain
MAGSGFVIRIGSARQTASCTALGECIRSSTGTIVLLAVWQIDLTLYSAHALACLSSSNGKFHFELYVQNELPHCEIHIFDFTDYTAQMNEWGVNASFHAWGLKGKDGSVNTFALHKSGKAGAIMKSIDETVTELGHRGRMIEIFKIDCEGCEVR